MARRGLIIFLVFFVVCLVLVNTSRAAVVAPSDSFPVAGASYDSQGPVFYSGPAMSVNVELVSLKLVASNPVNVVSPPPEGQSAIVDSFFDVFTELSVDGGNFQVDSFFDISIGLGIGNPTIGPAGTFDTEILSMSLTGNVGGIPIIIRESPTLPSSGQHDITPLPDGNYSVDSFFDVFTELSVDGGQTWTPADGSMPMLITPEPTTMLLLGLGAWGLRRKKYRVFSLKR